MPVHRVTSSCFFAAEVLPYCESLLYYDAGVWGRLRENYICRNTIEGVQLLLKGDKGEVGQWWQMVSEESRNYWSQITT